MSTTNDNPISPTTTSLVQFVGCRGLGAGLTRDTITDADALRVAFDSSTSVRDMFHAATQAVHTLTSCPSHKIAPFCRRLLEMMSTPQPRRTSYGSTLDSAVLAFDCRFMLAGVYFFKDTASLADLVTMTQAAPVMLVWNTFSDEGRRPGSFSRQMGALRLTTVNSCGSVLTVAMSYPTTMGASMPIKWFANQYNTVDTDARAYITAPAPGLMSGDTLRQQHGPMVPEDVGVMVKERLRRDGVDEATDLYREILGRIPVWDEVAAVTIQPNELLDRYYMLVCHLFSPKDGHAPSSTSLNARPAKRKGRGVVVVNFAPAIRALHHECVGETQDVDGDPCPVWSGVHAQSFLFLRLVTTDFITLQRDEIMYSGVVRVFEGDDERVDEALEACGGPPVEWKVKQDTIMSKLWQVDDVPDVCQVTNWTVVDAAHSTLSVSPDDDDDDLNYCKQGRSTKDVLTQLHDAAIDDDAFHDIIEEHNNGVEELVATGPSRKRVRTSSDDDSE